MASTVTINRGDEEMILNYFWQRRNYLSSPQQFLGVEHTLYYFSTFTPQEQDQEVQQLLYFSFRMMEYFTLS